jgi:RES domain-containing protein
MWLGVGARDHGGRWNSCGIAVAYASESRALAAMEQLVHLIPPQLLGAFVVSSIALADRQIERVDLSRLPRNWRNPVAPASLRRIGDKWVSSMRTLALAIPSAVVDGEANYLINPQHPDFAGARKSRPAPFKFDRRLK